MFCRVSPAATGPMMSRIFDGTALSVPRVLTARTKRSCKSSVHSTCSGTASFETNRRNLSLRFSPKLLFSVVCFRW